MLIRKKQISTHAPLDCLHTPGLKDSPSRCNFSPQSTENEFCTISVFRVIVNYKYITFLAVLKLKGILEILHFQRSKATVNLEKTSVNENAYCILDNVTDDTCCLDPND
ncbi:uncharacterized protein FN964_007491 [Alca torda]